jgi:hypothetical protein
MHHFETKNIIETPVIDTLFASWNEFFGYGGHKENGWYEHLGAFAVWRYFADSVKLSLYKSMTVAFAAKTESGHLLSEFFLGTGNLDNFHVSGFSDTLGSFEARKIRHTIVMDSLVNVANDGILNPDELWAMHFGILADYRGNSERFYFSELLVTAERKW